MRSTLCALSVALLTASGASGGPPIRAVATDGSRVTPTVCFTSEWFHGNKPVIFRHYGRNVIRVTPRSYGNI